MKEDALRRDFTINAMYLDPFKDEIHDFYNGQKDLEGGWIRFIGKPEERIYEDRLRVLRAFRFQAKLGFHLEEKTKQALMVAAKDIDHLSWERIHKELEKTIQAPHFLAKDQDFLRSGLIEHLFQVQKDDVLYGIQRCRSHKNYVGEWYTIFLAYHTNDLSVDFRLSKQVKKDLKLVKSFLSGELNDFQIKTKLSSKLGSALLYFLEATGNSDKSGQLRGLFSGLPENYVAPNALISQEDLPHLKGKDLGKALQLAYEKQVLEGLQDKTALLGLVK
jgi:tRNA nucleotidyltransferase/poly(A) polymerase